tara:strand:+ start:55596 stop:55817 length:222 start_codon:yes stop_codon:yes gene_type:complete
LKIQTTNTSQKGIYLWFYFSYICQKNKMYKFLAKLNKLILPSLTKSGLDITKAKGWQKALLAYRYFITIKSLK